MTSVMAHAPAPATPRRTLTGATAVLSALAAIKLLAHLLTGNNYGYFRDELYFIDASKHLDFGYVDFPPGVAVVGALTRAVLGESRAAMHILPAVAGAALVVVTGLIARELGGGRFAQGLAALATLVAPAYLGIDSLFSMNPFDELWWGLVAYLVVLILTRSQPQLWLLLGLVVGIGLLTKVTIFYWALGIVGGLLLTPRRTLLRSRWPLIAALIAGLLFLPYLGWQIAHAWPSVDFWRSYNGNTDQVSPLGFLVVQAVMMNALSLPLWLAGLYFYFFTAEGRPYRALGWAYVMLYVVFTALRAKFYFLAPAYPVLFAAGAVILEQRFLLLQRRRLTTYVAALATAGFALAVITLPVLPPATLAWVTGPIHLASNLGVQDEGQKASQLPQPFADRFGWDTLAATVARVYHHLPQRQQATACILARNYGEAGAIDLYGPAYGLPRAISGHDAYYQWGPGSCTGAVVIGVGWSRHTLAQVFRDVTPAATATCQYCMQYESHVPVYVARQPRIAFSRAWPRFKLYYAEWTS